MWNKDQLIGWILIVSVVISAWMITLFENLNLFFLSLVLVLNVLVICFRKSFGAPQVTAARLLMASVFLFSGFVKGVDPLGTQYRIEDYFTAFGTEWAKPYALTISVFLNAFEFILGILLLFNINIRATIWIVGIVMANFTIITLNDALYEPVPDCGCFGDALIISNWQTFYKNLVIDALFFIVFFARFRSKPWTKPVLEWGIAALIMVGFILFEIYNIRHLPVIDFSDWKIGNRLVHQDPQPKQFYLSYRNIITGEVREYLSPDYPYNDPDWMAEWEFVDQRVVDPNPPLHEVSLDDEYGNNHNSSVIENPEFQFILVSYNLDEANWMKIGDLREFIDECVNYDISFVVATASLPEEAEAFRTKHDLDVIFYFADDVTLKAIIRSNPGLILLKDGTVLNKWHHNDFPSIRDFLNTYPQHEDLN
ncbi:MAG: BT_3928 family protein [Bacteroidales bacterium]